MAGEHTRFERTLETARRDAWVAELRAGGLTYAQIAARVGLSKQAVHAGHRRAVRGVMRETAQEAVDLELDRLDLLYRTALGVMARRHVLSQNGRIVRDADGTPLEDWAPRLAAIDRCLKIMERRSRLLGLDAAAKADLRISDSLDAQIEQLAVELHFIKGVAARGNGDTDDPDPT